METLPRCPVLKTECRGFVSIRSHEQKRAPTSGLEVQERGLLFKAAHVVLLSCVDCSPVNARAGALRGLAQLPLRRVHEFDRPSSEAPDCRSRPAINGVRARPEDQTVQCKRNHPFAAAPKSPAAVVSGIAAGATVWDKGNTYWQYFVALPWLAMG
jgi:hypothetical protein